MHPRHPNFKQFRRKQIAVPMITLPNAATAAVVRYLPVPAVGEIVGVAVVLGDASAEDITVNVAVGSNSEDVVVAAGVDETEVTRSGELGIQMTSLDGVLVVTATPDADPTADIPVIVVIDYEVAV